MGKTGEAKTGEHKTGEPMVAAVQASATLAGSTTLTADGTQNIHANATLTGSATVSATGTQLVTGAATLAGSASLFPDTGFVPGVKSSGWHVVVIHPETHRRIQPDVLDEPAILPSLNSLPEIRIPVRKSDSWLDPAFEDDPRMQVWLDGVRQPIGILQEVEDREDRTILVGVGATELRDRVSAEYRSERRHDAAETLITDNTNYAADVDTPSVDTVTDEVLQNPTTTDDFNGLIDTVSTDPIDISNGDVSLYQTAFTVEGEDFDRNSGTDTFASTEYSGDAPDDGDGLGVQLDSQGEWVEYDFTTNYDIPDGEFEIWLRTENLNQDNDPAVEISFNGNSLGTGSISQLNIGWLDTIDGAPNFDDPTPISSGSHTIRIEATGDFSGNDSYILDVVAPVDQRYSYNFDNSVTTAGDGTNYLDGPELYPDAVEVQGDDATSAFSITTVDATIDIDDPDIGDPTYTTDQRLQVSNDRASTWEPSDGTEDNTDSVTVDYSSDPSSYLRLRTDLSRWESSGARTVTPSLGYDSQTVSEWTIQADIDLELLLIDQTYDQPLVGVLNDIAGNEFVWSANLDSNGDYQVSWTQPGARTASDDPDIGNISIRKNIDTFDRITIKGSNKGVTEESFPASSTFQELNNGDIIPGSETVYDASNGTNFDRGADYEMDYTAGEIRATNGGDLDTSQSYTIDYQVEVSGSYPSGVSNPDREFVDTIPGVVSDRGAEQIAFALFDGDAEDPRYEGDLSLPRPDVSFDPLDALTLDNLDLPSEATPLEVRGEPSITPSGLTLRLGSRPPIEQSLSSIAENVAAISKRS